MHFLCITAHLLSAALEAGIFKINNGCHLIVNILLSEEHCLLFSLHIHLFEYITPAFLHLPQPTFFPIFSPTGHGSLLHAHDFIRMCACVYLPLWVPLQSVPKCSLWMCAGGGALHGGGQRCVHAHTCASEITLVLADYNSDIQAVKP